MKTLTRKPVLRATYETLDHMIHELDAVESAAMVAMPKIPKRSKYLLLIDKLMAKEITVPEFTKLRERLIKHWGKKEYEDRFQGAV